MKINCKEDCGNAPLKEMIRDFNIAFAKGDVQAIVANITDNIVWEMVGDKTLEGKQAVTEVLESMKEYTALELTIEHIITHGKTASCNGSFVMDHEGQMFSFCDVYEFNRSGAEAKISKMTSFCIKLGE